MAKYTLSELGKEVSAQAWSHVKLAESEDCWPLLDVPRMAKEDFIRSFELAVALGRINAKQP